MNEPFPCCRHNHSTPLQKHIRNIIYQFFLPKRPRSLYPNSKRTLSRLLDILRIKPKKQSDTRKIPRASTASNSKTSWRLFGWSPTDSSAQTLRKLQCHAYRRRVARTTDPTCNHCNTAEGTTKHVLRWVVLQTHGDTHQIHTLKPLWEHPLDMVGFFREASVI